MAAELRPAGLLAALDRGLRASRCHAVRGAIVAFKTRVWVAALSGLLVAIMLSVVVFRMPLAMVLASGANGVVFGLIRIAWIIVSSLFLYQVAVETGQFQVMKESIAGFRPTGGFSSSWSPFASAHFSREPAAAVPGGNCGLISDRARVRAVPGRHSLPARQHGARGLGGGRYSNSRFIRSTGFSEASLVP